MSSAPVLDYTNMLAPSVGDVGVDPARLRGEADLANRFREAHEAVERARDRGDLGFFDLPYDHETARRVRYVADGFGQWFENLLVLGIGGSTLGTRALADALLGPYWNETSGEGRDHFPRLYVLENVDPDTVARTLAELDLRRTLVNVVSKSGSTAETMAQFLVLRSRLEEVVGEEEARGHLLLTTDPEKGALRELAREEGIPALPVPPGVGGRYSVLSPVGLLPAAATGMDVDALLRGAARMDERCRTPNLEENPAGLLAVLLYRAQQEEGQGTHVLMPYSDGLRSFSLWFQQLWAESLGKDRRDDTEGPDEGWPGSATPRDGRGTPTGPTPLPAVGATDQHSQVQLFMEGPSDKVVVFVSVGEREDPVTLPDRHPGVGAFGYLGGHTMEELLDVERKATEEALRQRGRPSMTLEIPRLDAETLGQLLMLFQIGTVHAGALYGVNPMDQPGVELGKELTYGLLGREGFEAPSLREEDRRRA